jgi:hypothetical protein
MSAKRITDFAIVALAAALALWLALSSRDPIPAAGDGVSKTSDDSRSHKADKSGTAAVRSLQSADRLPEIPAHLRATAAALESSGSPDASRKLLHDLRTYMLGLPAESAVRALREFLDARSDVLLKLEFAIGADGLLKEAPSLRVWLLDCLGQIDRDAAAGYARAILATWGSPDEWAVSLRDYALARTAPDDIVFVQSKVRELINNPAWQQNPSAGFLEAFDTIVYTGATSLTPDLVQLVSKKDNRALAHAAYLTLDRLVLDRPTEVLSKMASSPSLMQGREQTRANYFARADVRDPEQRRVLENYLLDSRRTPQELETFAGIYPNANYMISTNLLTRSAGPAHIELTARDRAALEVVETWLHDPRFGAVKGQIQQIHARLKTFVAEAAETAK